MMSFVLICLLPIAGIAYPFPSPGILQVEPADLVNEEPMFPGVDQLPSQVQQQPTGQGGINEFAMAPRQQPQNPEAAGNGGVMGLPYFLDGTSVDVQNKFLSIIQNREESNTRKQQRIDQLIASLGENNQKLYERFQREKASEEKLHRAKIHGIVAKMSPEAQKTFAKLDTLLMNTELSDYDKWQQMEELYKNMDPAVRNEFNEKFAGQ